MTDATTIAHTAGDRRARCRRGRRGTLHRRPRGARGDAVPVRDEQVHRQSRQKTFRALRGHAGTVVTRERSGETYSLQAVRETGATGLEPATSGVTGRPGARAGATQRTEWLFQAVSRRAARADSSICERVRWHGAGTERARAGGRDGSLAPRLAWVGTVVHAAEVVPRCRMSRRFSNARAEFVGFPNGRKYMEDQLLWSPVNPAA
jgi:hypothetical protein